MTALVAVTAGGQQVLSLGRSVREATALDEAAFTDLSEQAFQAARGA